MPYRKCGIMEHLDRLNIEVVRGFTEEEIERCGNIIEKLRVHEVSLFAGYLSEEINKLSSLSIQLEKLYRVVFNDGLDFKTKEHAEIVDKLSKAISDEYAKLAGSNTPRYFVLIAEFGVALAHASLMNLLDVCRGIVERWFNEREANKSDRDLLKRA